MVNICSNSYNPFHPTVHRARWILPNEINRPTSLVILDIFSFPAWYRKYTKRDAYIHQEKRATWRPTFNTPGDSCFSKNKLVYIFDRDRNRMNPAHAAFTTSHSSLTSLPLHPSALHPLPRMTHPATQQPHANHTNVAKSYTRPWEIEPHRPSFHAVTATEGRPHLDYLHLNNARFNTGPRPVAHNLTRKALQFCMFIFRHFFLRL